MQTATAFSPAVRAVLDDLCDDLSRRTRRTVTADYGQTECGQFHDAALCIESLPAGSWGQPGPLVSVLAGPGVPGGFVVLGADGIPKVEGVGLEVAVQAAKSEAVRAYRVAQE